MPYFNIVAETTENTVVTTYEPAQKRSDAYQSEAELEAEFIRQLCEQGYTYLPIHKEADLLANLCAQLETLNGFTFTDAEWSRFLAESVANPNEHIVEKTRKIQEDNVQVLTRDDGTTKNVTLIDKRNIHNNRLQVINQYTVKQGDGARHDNRYDVTILVNICSADLSDYLYSGQRSAAGTHRAKAPRRSHSGSLQPDRPLSARFLLVRMRTV